MGKRIKDTDIIEQTQFEPKLRLLVDKTDADVGFPWMQAKNIQLKYLGNAYFQGSTNNSTWHDNIAAIDSYIRFTTDGGVNWRDFSTKNVREDTNLYFTEARVLATTGVVDAITATHVHANFDLLNNIVDSGDGNSFLSNDGTYKTASIVSTTKESVIATAGQSIVVFTSEVTANSLIFVNADYVDDYTITDTNEITFPFELNENDKITKK